MELSELFQKFANMEQEERIEYGRGAYVKLMEDLKSHGLDDEKATTFCMMVISVALSADRFTAEEEYRLMLGIMDATEEDLSFEKFYTVTDGGANPDLVNSVDNFIDGMSEEGKTAATLLALVFIAADDKITPSEQRLFARLLA